MSAPADPGLGPPPRSPEAGGLPHSRATALPCPTPRGAGQPLPPGPAPGRCCPSVPAVTSSALFVLRGIPYLSKHRADRVKRLGDFLNRESFDLALLEEVGPRGPGVEARREWGRLGRGRGLPPWGKGRQVSSPLPSGVERAGLPVLEAEAAARLPSSALLQEVRSPLARKPGLGAGGPWPCQPFPVLPAPASLFPGVLSSGCGSGRRWNDEDLSLQVIKFIIRPSCQPT